MAEKDAVLPEDVGDTGRRSHHGLPSSGIHSNGLSLARKVIPESDRAGWEDLLVPTRIYAREMARLPGHGQGPCGRAHHGRGLLGNLSG